MRSRAARPAHDERPAGTPVGRRTVLGLVALGAAGVVGGSRVQNALARWLGPSEEHDPTGLLSLLPIGDAFRYYSVAGTVPSRTAATYRLAVSGEVAHPTVYTLADLQALPQTAFTKDFQCVTGWRVLDVHWRGVRLSTLLAAAEPSGAAKAVTFQSFDGIYTESLTLEEAMRSDVIIALEMLGKPVTHDHGGPVRMYCASMYGYKSTKWLSGIELTSSEVPGYWETRGYSINGTIGE